MGILATWADDQGLASDGPALTTVTDDNWAFEELSPNTTTGTDPPRSADPNCPTTAAEPGVTDAPRND